MSPFPATTGSSSVKSARFLTVDVEPVGFTRVCAWVDPARVAQVEGATHCHAFKREGTAQLPALQTTTGSYFGTMIPRACFRQN